MLIIPKLFAQTESLETAYFNKLDAFGTYEHPSGSNQAIQHANPMTTFYAKLYDLYMHPSTKVNVVHIGDSHIQAGFITEKVRKDLQQVFGNAGLGFVFPHRLVKSNGIMGVQFSSNALCEGKRNIFADASDLVGLSGFSFKTEAKDFAIQMKISDSDYDFHSVRYLTPNQQAVFALADTDQEINFNAYQTNFKNHKIKSGEALSIIARKYGVSVAAIKKANNMRSDAIRAGANLKIPVQVKADTKIDRSKFNLVSQAGVKEYYFADLKNSLWLLGHENHSDYALSGLILERNNPGLIYHGIGVNGARFMDYNKTNLFFEQLAELKADLFVISLGTNESFDELEAEEYIAHLEDFVANIKNINPHAAILISTPPPSFVKRVKANHFAENYAKELLDWGHRNNVAVWDMHSALGGNANIRANQNQGLVARDFVHYSIKGYEHTGAMLSEALLNGFYNYLQTKE